MFTYFKTVMNWMIDMLFRSVSYCLLCKTVNGNVKAWKKSILLFYHMKNGHLFWFIRFHKPVVPEKDVFLFGN